MAGTVACGLLLFLAWHSGGYFPHSHLLAGTIAFATLALVLAVRPPHYRLSTPALIAAAMLALFAVWTGLSAWWSSAPDVALEDFQRTLLYGGLFGLGLLAAGSGRYSRHLVWAVLAVTVAILVAALLSRLYPDIVSSPEPTIYTSYRLNHPFGYSNAVGAMAALALVLAAGLAGDPRSPLALRCLAAAATVPVGVAGYLSFSRGAWLALFLGVVLLVALARDRVALAATLGLVAGVLAFALSPLDGFAALTDDPGAGGGQLAEGHAYGPTVAILTIVCGLLQGVASLRWLPADARGLLGRVTRRLVAVAAVVLGLAGAGVYALRSDDAESRAAARIASTESWFDRQWDDFMSPAVHSADRNAQRLTTAQGTRSDLWRVAIDGFQARPLAGDGAGGFEYRFAHDRETSDKVRDAHSLYLETLGELGIPGLALLLSFLGCIAWAGVTARRRHDVLTPGQAAAACAACAVWMGHAAVDWDWQLPALSGAAIVLAASMFPVGRRGRRRARKRSGEPEGPTALPLERAAPGP